MLLRAARFVAVAALAATAAAQVGVAPTLYRLDPATTFEEGCQPPCLCPIAWTDDVFGTQTVRFSHSDPAWFDHYEVADVNWTVELFGREQRVTGVGEYKVGGQFALRHQLQLALSFDGAPPVRFDSGLVPGGGTFPRLAIDIAEHGFYCFDRVFRLQASAVPASEIAPVRLGRSQYVEGCWAPCTCPVSIVPAGGRFDLVDLGPASDPARHHFALVNIDWRTRPVSAAARREFTGYGLLTLDANTVQQRMVTDLTDGAGLAQRFDSGLVSGGGGAPATIDVDLAVNGFYCYDYVLQLHVRQ